MQSYKKIAHLICLKWTKCWNNLEMSVKITP